MYFNILVGAQEGWDFNPKMKIITYPKLKVIMISHILVGAQESWDLNPKLKILMHF